MTHADLTLTVHLRHSVRSSTDVQSGVSFGPVTPEKGKRGESRSGGRQGGGGRERGRGVASALSHLRSAPPTASSR